MPSPRVLSNDAARSRTSSIKPPVSPLRGRTETLVERERLDIPVFDLLALLAPGHGYRFRDVAVRAAASAEHHLRRSCEVATVLTDAPDTSNREIAARLTWTAGWRNLTDFFVYSALTRTVMHRNYLAWITVG